MRLKCLTIERETDTRRLNHHELLHDLAGMVIGLYRNWD